MAHTVVFEYVVDDDDTIHLARQDAIYSVTLAKTLCNQGIGGWGMGDETLSGLAATCLRCLDLRTEQKGTI